MQVGFIADGRIPLKRSPVALRHAGLHCDDRGRAGTVPLWGLVQQPPEAGAYRD